MKRVLFKLLGGILGILSILFGIHLLLNPLFDSSLEKIDCVAFLILGGFLIKYAVTGNKH